MINKRSLEELFRKNKISKRKYKRFLESIDLKNSFMAINYADVDAIIDKTKRLDMINLTVIGKKKVVLVNKRLKDIKLLKKVKGVVVNVISNEDISLSDSVKIGENVCDLVNKDAKVVWGLKVDNNLVNKTKVELICAY